MIKQKNAVEDVKKLINNIDVNPQKKVEYDNLVHVANHIEKAGGHLNNAVDKALIAVDEAKTSSQNIKDNVNQDKADDAAENAKKAATIAKVAAEKAEKLYKQAKDSSDRIKTDDDDDDNDESEALVNNTKPNNLIHNKTPIMNDAFIIMHYTINTLDDLLDIFSKHVGKFLEI